jgi:hypothetical protein
VGEVWFWKDDAITFHVLIDGVYEQREASTVLPTFDRQLAYEILTLPTLSDVKRALRERLG